MREDDLGHRRRRVAGGKGDCARQRTAGRQGAVGPGAEGTRNRRRRSAKVRNGVPAASASRRRRSAADHGARSTSCATTSSAVVALLDVSVLVALFDPSHVHHEIAHDWFEDQRTGRLGDLRDYREWARPHSAPARRAPIRRTGRLICVDDAARSCAPAAATHYFWPDVTLALTTKASSTRRLSGVTSRSQMSICSGWRVSAGGALATFDRSISSRRR